MRIRNEVLRNMRILCGILAGIVYGTGIVFKIANIQVNKSLQGIYWGMVAIVTLYILVAFWPKPIITRWFDKYYDTLSEAEKERFDREVENVKRTRYFLTSKEIVQRGMVITPIADIVSVQYSECDVKTKGYLQRDKVVILKGEKGNKSLVPVNVGSRKKGEELIQAILKRKPEIVRESNF